MVHSRSQPQKYFTAKAYYYKYITTNTKIYKYRIAGDSHEVYIFVFFAI